MHHKAHSLVDILRCVGQDNVCYSPRLDLYAFQIGSLQSVESPNMGAFNLYAPIWAAEDRRPYLTNT